MCTENIEFAREASNRTESILQHSSDPAQAAIQINLRAKITSLVIHACIPSHYLTLPEYLKRDILPFETEPEIQPLTRLQATSTDDLDVHTWLGNPKPSLAPAAPRPPYCEKLR